MPLITLFSAPKPFTDPHIAMIQRNAVKSWTLLPDVEVILLGKEQGLAEAARDLGVQHFPDVACNETGTPLISSMFQFARSASQRSMSELLGIVNTDMLLMSDFVRAAKRVAGQRDRFVLLSQRWDYDITAPIEFDEDWADRLRSLVLGQDKLHRPSGSDFFLFPKTCYTHIPDFAIGRAGWDNWMIYAARKEGWPVIDCTPSVMIVHQNHDYSHLPGAKTHHDHPDSNENIRLAGGQAAIRYTIVDSTHCLAGDRITRPKASYLRFMRGVELFLRRIFFFLPEAMIENVARPKRWKKRFERLFKNPPGSGS